MASRIIYGLGGVGVDYSDNIYYYIPYTLFLYHIKYKRKNVVFSGIRFYVGKRHKIVYDNDDDVVVVSFKSPRSYDGT